MIKRNETVEKQYFNSIKKSKNSWSNKNLSSKYLQYEQSNDRLQKLLYKFSTDKGSQLKSVTQSIMYHQSIANGNNQVRDPNFNLMKSGDVVIKNSIVNRENNSQIKKGLSNYNLHRNRIWNNNINNIKMDSINNKENYQTTYQNFYLQNKNTQKHKIETNSIYTSNFTETTRKSKMTNITKSDLKKINQKINMIKKN